MTDNIEGIYYPCFDDRLPVCRQFVNQQWCRRRLRCSFYHPLIITPVIKKKANRKLGHCYCGARQQCLLNRKPLRKEEDPLFFVVCGRTHRSMNKCLSEN